jgi:hypothetical protein
MNAAPAPSGPLLGHEPGRPLHAFLSFALWTLTGLSLGYLLLLGAGLTLWSMAAGQNPTSFLLIVFAVLACWAVALNAVRVSQRARRLPYASRAALLGAVACPLPLIGALWTLSAIG